MKKTMSILLLSVNIVCANDISSSQISADLDAFMTLKPIPKQYFEHNAYIGWMGLTYPKDDWLTAYRAVFEHNDQMLNQRAHDGRLITNYFTNPSLSIFQFTTDKFIFDDLLGVDEKLRELQDDLNGQKLLSFRQKSFAEKRYRYTQDFFVCADYLDELCLAKMQNRRQYIQDIIRMNKKLLERFEVLVKNSQYNYALFHNDFNASIDTIPSSGMIKLIQLYLTDAIMKIADGKIEDGLNQLVVVRQWIDLGFHEKSKAALLHFFVNISVTQFLDQTMNVLLDNGLFNGVINDERLAWIVRPYDQNIGQKLNEVVLFEMQQDFKDFAYPYIKIYTAPLSSQTFTEEDEFIILSFLKDFGVILSPALNELYDVRAAQAQSNAWLNGMPKSNKSSVRMLDRKRGIETLQINQERFLQVLIDWYQNYFQTLGLSPKEALLILNERYPSIEFYNDYFNVLQILSSEENLQRHLSSKVLQETLKGRAMPKTLAFIESLPTYSDFDSYWVRLYEQQNYHQMVYLKFLIMKERIPSQQIPKFLESMGNLARHTITKKAYRYDRNAHKLSTPLPKQNKYLPIHIKILRMYDSNISNFEVILPKY